MNENRRLRVFLCHSSADKPMVRDLHKMLSLEQWIEPWLDEVMLKPGQDWQSEIEKAVDQTDVVIVCLSQNSITKEGYVQKEIKKALDKAEEKPEDTIFIIPLRFEECNVPRRLAKWHWEDHFKENWYSRLIESLRLRGERLGISLISLERYALINSLTDDGFEQIAAELQRTKRILTIKETELKAVIAQADEISHTDSLTFLPNRRQILGDLTREVIFSERSGTPLSISMLEVDQFREIKDTYGQMVGDDILRSIASEFREVIHYPNMIGRYEGEEFLIIMPNYTGKAASELIASICQRIRSLSINLGEHIFHLTVSIGITEYEIHEDWSKLLERADQALIKAKRNGRDQWAIL